MSRAQARRSGAHGAVVEGYGRTWPDDAALAELASWASLAADREVVGRTSRQDRTPGEDTHGRLPEPGPQADRPRTGRPAAGRPHCRRRDLT